MLVLNNRVPTLETVEKR